MKEISLKISDIDCAACVERLNRALGAVNGVRAAAVNYASGRALISYDEDEASIASIAAAVKKAGFGVPADSVELKCPALDAETMSRALAALRAMEEVQSAEQNAETGGILVRVWPVNPDSRRLLAALREVGVWAELGEMTSGEEESEVRKRLALLRLIVAATLLSVPLVWEMHYLVQFVIATVIQFWPGMYFYRGACRGLRNGTMNMDVLVALSATIIYLYSSYVAFTVPIGKMLYFLSNGVLIALLLFGRYLEQLAMGESSQAIRRLMRLQPKTALVQRGGEEKELSIEEIEEHDVVIIRPGERVPVDGVIIEGRCAVDESLLTGESLPVDKAEGDELLGGTLNRSGSVKLAATRLGKDSVLQQIIDLVQRAQSSKAPVQRLADKIAAVFGCAGMLPPKLTDFENLPGLGVTGRTGGETLAAGSRELMARLGVDISPLAALPDVRSQAKTEVCVARCGKLLGVIGVADRLRPDAAETVRRLKKLGVELWLITGDNERTAQAVAAECDIEYVLSGVLPENKAEKVRELQSRGLKLAMVGDGINDAPALAAADTAIAMGGGTDVAIESSDITLLGGRLSAVPDALEVSRATMGAIRLNLAWALLYNVLSVGAAAFGVVNPSMAAAAMSLSSIAVLMNSLRLKKAVEKK